MDKAITQREAKVMIRDYLTATGRKGVTSLMRDIQTLIKREFFSKRTLELWLENQKRTLDDDNWEVVLAFLDSDKFKRYVPYANEGPAAKRLKQVAEGFVALYGETKHPNGIHILPSAIKNTGRQAVIELSGNWENVPNQQDSDVPRTICKIEPVEGERYAKFAYIALFRSKQISATGIAIYLNSQEAEGCDYIYSFVLQLWRRRDPESGSAMPGELVWLTDTRNQPEFSISGYLNEYFYKNTGPGAPSDQENVTRIMDASEAIGDKFRSKFSQAVVLKKNRHPIPEEIQIIDQLLEDVLPHGYAEA